MSINNEFNPANFDYNDSSKVSKYVLNINNQKLVNQKILLINEKWEVISEKILELSKIDSKSELKNAIKDLEFLRNQVILEIENLNIEFLNSPNLEQP